MKSLFLNIKNSLPYFLLIAVYFFFVNIEAQKDRSKLKNDHNNIVNENNLKNFESDKNKNNIKIEIPVIPFKE